MPEPITFEDRLDKITGVLLGAAVGDSLGLPREGLSRRRAARLYGTGPLRHRFLLGKGMISDDAEHACMTAQALLAASDDEERFARSLGWRLRGWLACMPAAVGFATLRAILKLWIGFSPQHSGVRSAGNGPAMRAPVLGACLANRPDRIEPMVRASTRITHRDVRAEEGALAIALAAAYATTHRPDEVRPSELLQSIQQRVTHDALRQAIDKVGECLDKGASCDAFAKCLQFDEGVSGYIVHTVPAALFCWLSSPGDIKCSVEEMILLGGDADSTGAIVGALAGATVGATAIPEAWLNNLVDWPRSVVWIRKLARRLTEQFEPVLMTDDKVAYPEPQGALPLFWPALLARNGLFLVVVLGHGFRRLLPPY